MHTAKHLLFLALLVISLAGVDKVLAATGVSGVSGVQVHVPVR